MNDSAFSETFSDDLLAAMGDQDDPLLGLEAHLVEDENEVRKKSLRQQTLSLQKINLIRISIRFFAK
jgi:hypothetical protein